MPYNRGPKLEPFRDEVIAFYNAGHSLQEAGERFGASFQTVRRFLMLAGVPLRSTGETMRRKWADGSFRHRRLVPDQGGYRTPGITRTQASIPFADHDEPTRRCPKCERHLPASEWSRFQGPSRSPYCKSCFAIYLRGRECEESRERARVRTREYAARNKERLYAMRRSLKLEVIAAYGGKCACCGETAHEFLTVDHIHGNGNRHRKFLKSKGQPHLYPWLKKHGFPADFRLLCFNCNWSIGHFGYCPHQPDAGKQIPEDALREGEPNIIRC